MDKNSHNQSVGSTVERSDERIKETGEVFTPMSLVERMIDDIEESVLRDPSSTFLDNSAGSGNFMVGLLNKLSEFHSRDHIVNHMLFAVEREPDNHAELCSRLGVSTDHPHFVCYDALLYNYSFGEDQSLEESPLSGLM